MSNHPSHSRIVREVPFVDHRGKTRTRTEVSYIRSPESEKEALAQRLGPYAAIPTSSDSRIQKDEARLLIITPYNVSRQIIATKLWLHNHPYKVLSGAEVLSYYLDRSEENYGQALMRGFPNIPELYLQFGYFEAPNRYLPSLIVQLLGQRNQLNLSCWLFIPKPLPALSAQWGSSLMDLSYLPSLMIPYLTDGIPDTPSPVVSHSVKPDITEEKIPDKKFIPKRKKRFPNA